MSQSGLGRVIEDFLSSPIASTWYNIQRLADFGAGAGLHPSGAIGRWLASSLPLLDIYSRHRHMEVLGQALFSKLPTGRATSDERRATNDERRATSDERRAVRARQHRQPSVIADRISRTDMTVCSITNWTLLADTEKNNKMSSLSRRACYKCGNVGHYAEVCSSSERLCYNCMDKTSPRPRTVSSRSTFFLCIA